MLNLDLSKFNRDRQGIAASQAIAQDLQLAAQLQITGTPFFLAISSTNIEAVSGVDFERLESVLDQAIPK
ncbi:DsbA family protein [Leptolyngbyaceae cyanobacterium UHCC 1019]